MIVLDTLRLLRVGWDGYHAPPPNDVALRAAARMLNAARQAGLEADRAVASADGGVGCYFFARPDERRRYVSLHCGNDGSMAVLFVDRGTGECDAVEVDSVGEPAGLLERIRSWLA